MLVQYRWWTTAVPPRLRWLHFFCPEGNQTLDRQIHRKAQCTWLYCNNISMPRTRLHRVLRMVNLLLIAENLGEVEQAVHLISSHWNPAAHNHLNIMACIMLSTHTHTRELEIILYWPVSILWISFWADRRAENTFTLTSAISKPTVMHIQKVNRKLYQPKGQSLVCKRLYSTFLFFHWDIAETRYMLINKGNIWINGNCVLHHSGRQRAPFIRKELHS